MKGGGHTSNCRLVFELDCPLQLNSRTGTVLYLLVTASIVLSIKSRVLAAIVRHPKDPLTRTSAPSAGCNDHHHSGSGIHGQHRRHTTTEVVPRVESEHKDASGYPRLPKAAGWGRVPTGPPLGAPCPYRRGESRVVKPHELLHKGSGIKAVFSLAPLPGRPCMGESPCSLG